MKAHAARCPRFWGVFQGMLQPCTCAELSRESLPRRMSERPAPSRRHRALWAAMKREAARQGVSVRQAVLLGPRRR